MMPFNRKLSVFIGSPSEQLKEVRNRIIYAVLEAGHIPVGMELWAADYIPTKQAIQRYLYTCDLHIVILGASYGTVFDEKISYTEWECEKSFSVNRPVITFLLGKEEFNAEFNKMPVESKDKEKLKNFRKQLESKSICRYFCLKNLDQLALSCINAIHHAEKTLPSPMDAGWIRAASSEGVRMRAEVDNIFLRRIIDRVYGFDSLTSRIQNGAKAKRTAGEVFWHEMQGRLRRYGYTTLFFDSGSTLAYVADEFEHILRKFEIPVTTWNVATNNALVFLQLVLNTRIPVAALPPGSPDEKYGAMLSESIIGWPEAAPRVPRSLYKHETESVMEMVKELKCDVIKVRNDLEKCNEPPHCLFLMAASGLDLINENEHFRGPHVGSHSHMLFKRAVFKSEQPVVLFISKSKLKYPFQVGKCYSVCGNDFPWKYVLENQAFALVVGDSPYDDKSNLTKKDSISKEKLLENLLKDLILELSNYSELSKLDFNYASGVGRQGVAVIAANDSFAKIFPKE